MAREDLLSRVLTYLFGLEKPRALPIKAFSQPGDYTWEDWRIEAKENHPIRYFLSETLTLWWHVHIIMQIEHFIYWLRSHTTRRYHLIDIRQPYTNSDDDYKWGWIDEDRQFVLASFTILVKHVDLRNSSAWFWGTTEKELDKLRKELAETDKDMKIGIQSELDFLLELKALYDYWTLERKDELRQQTKLLNDWHDHREEDRKNKDNTRLDKIREAEESFYKHEEEMLIRLVKIRRGMWT